MSADPLVSVVMPVRDGARYVGDAIGSIQGQRWTNWELVVVENGSSDDSAGVVARLAAEDRRITLLAGLEPGRARAANLGVAQARGTHIALMDQDDIASPDRFRLQLEWMTRNRVEICGSWVQRFGDRDELMWFPETHTAIERELVFRCALMQPSVMLEAPILRRNPYAEAVHFDDHELWMRLSADHRMGNIPAVLLRYRSHPLQTSRALRAEFAADVQRLRAPLVRRLLPDAETADLEAIDRIGAGLAFTSIEALERGGSLLTQLADHPDPLLRMRMLQRWREACRVSAESLGEPAEACYRAMAPGFDPVAAEMPA